jgi:hypothetical protein
MDIDLIASPESAASDWHSDVVNRTRQLRVIVNRAPCHDIDPEHDFGHAHSVGHINHEVMELI